jgi:hypothetical protein
MLNLVVDCVSHHDQESSCYCCELNEMEELNEFGSRLRSFDPSELILLSFNSDFFQDLFAHADNSALKLSCSRAFFPNGLHVPIYKGKCVFLI